MILFPYLAPGQCQDLQEGIPFSCDNLLPLHATGIGRHELSRSLSQWLRLKHSWGVGVLKRACVWKMVLVLSCKLCDLSQILSLFSCHVGLSCTCWFTAVVQWRTHTMETGPRVWSNSCRIQVEVTLPAFLVTRKNFFSMHSHYIESNNSGQSLSLIWNPSGRILLFTSELINRASWPSSVLLWAHRSRWKMGWADGKTPFSDRNYLFVKLEPLGVTILY